MRRFRHHPLLGTFVEVRVGFAEDDDEVADVIDEAVVREMGRLESVFSVYDPSSELERWKRGVAAAGSELTEVLRLALDWQRRSSGAFNPSARLLHERWRSAEESGSEPSTAERRSLADRIAVAPYAIDATGAVVVAGDLASIDLNAIAKGWIVDRAVAAGVSAATDVGLGADAIELVVSAGGDLRHVGSTPIAVGIEHPLRPYDNEPPVARAALVDAALATSGGARRGFVVEGARRSHLIDPRTGEPVDELASVSVIADDAATADVVATIAALHEPNAALELAAEWATTALAVTNDGEVLTGAGWPAAP